MSNLKNKLNKTAKVDEQTINLMLNTIVTCSNSILDMWATNQEQLNEIGEKLNNPNFSEKLKQIGIQLSKIANNVKDIK